MLRAAIGFFAVAIIAMVLGMYNVAGLSADLGRMLLFLFLALSVLSFLASLFFGRKSSPPV